MTYLRHRELSVINGWVLFGAVTLDTLLFLIYSHFYFTYWLHLFKINT